MQIIIEIPEDIEKDFIAFSEDHHYRIEQAALVAVEQWIENIKSYRRFKQTMLEEEKGKKGIK